jgi:hypothetical protein
VRVPILRAEATCALSYRRYRRGMDWFRWHDGYEGHLASRLETVQAQLDTALAETTGHIRIISICAGQGHDVIGSLQRFPRRDDEEALLVELDERNVEAARQRVADAKLSDITVTAGDAGVTDPYRPMVPANVILACGVFGSLTDEHIDRTISLMPTLASAGAQVIWTAHRAAPGLWDTTITSFRRHGFEEVWTNDGADRFGVGRHRLARPPEPFRDGEKLFSFAPEETLVRLGRTRT